jgi:CHRD domain
MKLRLACLIMLLVCSACTQDTSRSFTNPMAPGPVLRSSAAAASATVSVPLNFRAHLSGDDVVPPRDTRAQGEAVLQLSEDGTALSYVVIASNIENVTGAHIHLGAAGAVGPNVVFLFGPVPPAGGRTNGVVAEGTITAANLINALAGQPLSVLIDAIAAGNAYVDVPTNDGVPPAFTGPGDFVTGEIRGQLR